MLITWLEELSNFVVDAIEAGDDVIAEIVIEWRGHDLRITVEKDKK